MPTPNTVQARLIWTVGPELRRCVTVLHGLKDGSDPLAGISAMATDVATAWSTAAITNLMHSATAITRLELSDISSDEIAEASAAVTGAAGHLSAGQLLPLDTQLCVTLRTAKRGRSFRGRVFLPGWGEIANDNGLATSAATAAADSLMEQIRALWTDNGFLLGVCSRVLNQTNQVTSILVRDAHWDTQRRRDR